MSVGNPILRLRVTKTLQAEIERAITELNRRRFEEPYDLSSFVRAAIREKLAHMQRSRKSGRRKSVARPEERVKE